MLFRTADRYLADSFYIQENKFFIIWRLDEVGNFTKHEASRNQTESASLSVTTILKIIRKIHDILKKTEDLSQVRRTRATLHTGSVIQSITGSWIKLDTTHLSPDISFLHNLHKTMTDYDIDFVLSSRVYNLIPECMKFECRLIDVLKFSVS